MKPKIPKPRLVACELTRRCRFSCKHCRANADLHSAEKELTTDQWKKIFKAIADFTKCVIILTGGEPLERDDAYQLIRYGRDLRLRMVMATCGYTINDDSIVRLKKAGITALSFSLDGASAETNDKFRQTDGAFDIAVKAARLASKAHIRFQINTTITKTNVNEVIAIADLATKLGAYCFNPFILVPVGRGKRIADEILDPVEYEALLNELLRLKLNSKIEVRVTCGPQFTRICKQQKIYELIHDSSGCIGGSEFAFVNCQGNVQTCGFLDISAGNLIENHFDFAEIWTESGFLNEIRNYSDYKGKCGICEYAALCGGCRARAYMMTGDYLASDPVCYYQPSAANKRPT